MGQQRKTLKHQSLADYCRATSAKKVWLAAELGVSRFQMAGLLYPDRYPAIVSDDVVERIAKLLNQTPHYVRKLYPRAA